MHCAGDARVCHTSTCTHTHWHIVHCAGDARVWRRPTYAPFRQFPVCQFYKWVSFSYSELFIQWALHTVSTSYSELFIQWAFHTLSSSYSELFIQWALHTVSSSYSELFILWALHVVSSSYTRSCQNSLLSTSRICHVSKFKGWIAPASIRALYCFRQMHAMPVVFALPMFFLIVHLVFVFCIV